MGVRRRLCCPQGFQNAPSSVAGSRPLFFNSMVIKSCVAGEGSRLALLLFLLCVPPLSPPPTCPKPTGDQVLGQAEPTWSWGGDWMRLLLIPAPPRLSSVWVPLHSLQGSTPEQGKSRDNKWPGCAWMKRQTSAGDVYVGEDSKGRRLFCPALPPSSYLWTQLACSELGPGWLVIQASSHKFVP